MSYKKYIKRGGKVFGPYIYHSRKVNGKVISEYLGKSEEKKEKITFPIFLTMAIAVLILAIILVPKFIPNNQEKVSFLGTILNFESQLSKLALTGFATEENGVSNSEQQVGTEQNEIPNEVPEETIPVDVPETSETVENVINETISENNAIINEAITENNISIPEANITVPEENTSILETNISIPETNITIPEQNITPETIPKENVTIPEANITISENISENNATIPNATVILTEENITIETIQYQAVLNQKVRWKKQIISQAEGNLTIRLPKEAENIIINRIENQNKEKFSSFSITGGVINTNSNGFFAKLLAFLGLTSRAVDENGEGQNVGDKKEIEVELEIDNSKAEYEVEYETPAPYAIEQEIERGKEITIVGLESIHYENVLSFTTLKEISKEKIRLYRTTDGIMEITPITNYIDANSNGLIDGIEWTVPQLSNQTYEVIIEISKAEHLDKDKQFISDIYEQVKTLDDIWSEEINNKEYVRVTFEQNLTNENDISLYPKIISGNPRIEVYEKNEENLIAEFSEISSNEYNKVYLTNLQGSQDTFDLKVVGGAIQIDYIVDPAVNLLPNATTNKAWNGSLNDNSLVIESSTVLLEGDYAKINRTDTNAYTAPMAGDAGSDGYVFVNFTLPAAESYSFINVSAAINVSITSGTMGIALWNFNTEAWDKVKAITGSATRTVVSLALSAQNISDFVSGTDIRVMAFDNSNSASTFRIDSILINVSYTAPDTEYPQFSSYWNNSEQSEPGTAEINVTVTSTNGTVILTFDNTNYTASNKSGSATRFNVTITNLNQGTYYYNWSSYGNGTSKNYNISKTFSYTVGAAPDATNPRIIIRYPSNYTNSSSNTLNVNYTASDANLAYCWYSNDSYSKNTSLNDCNTNLTTITWADGEHFVTVWANDTTGNQNSSSVRFTIDTIKPAIAITFPSNNTNTTNNQIGVNYTVSDSVFVSSCWYSNDSYTKNESLANCGTNITGVTWTEGAHNIRVYANDSAGNTNVTSVRFTIDTIKPAIAITFSNNTNTTNNQIGVNYTVSDSVFVSSCWYSNDSYTKNESLANCGTNITGVTWTEGAHNIRVYANDSAGNTNVTSVRFTIDTIKPNIEITFPSNNTNTSNTQLNINYSISDTNLAYCWYSNDSYKKNTSISNCANITGVTWAEGKHNMTVYVNDSAGNENSSNIYFTIDTTQPAIAITFPSNNTNTTNTGLDINYTASDNVAVGSCWYSNDSYSKNESLTDCGTNITDVTWTEGVHNIRVYANDSVGNTNVTSIKFTIDTTQPAIAITFPSNNTNTTNNQIGVNYTVSDSVFVSSCWYSNDSYTKNESLANCGINITGITWTEGTHNVRVYVNDSSGNTNVSSIRFTVDTTQPAIAIISPSNSTNTTDTGLDVNYTVDSTAISCWYSNDSYTKNESLTDCGTNITDVTWTEGVHNIRVYANDSVGNTNVTSIKFTIDTTQPAIAITFPSNNTNTTNNQIGVNYTVSDSVFVSSCWYSNDSFSKNESLADCGTNITDVTWAEGVHNIRVYANDSAGNTNVSSIRFTVDTTQPAIAITFPSNNTNTSNTGLDINYTVSDSVFISRCWYSNDSYTKNESLACGTNITTVTWAEGVHNVRVYANDSAGNTNVTSVRFTIDTTKPAIAIISPSNNTNTSNTGLDVNYTVDNTAISCWYSNDSYSKNESLTDCGTNITDVTWAEGVHNIRVYANDSVGNVNSTSVKFTIDTTAPTIAIRFPSNGAETFDSGINVNYTVSDSVAVGSCWYSNDSYSKNESLANCGTNITDVTWANGQHNVTVWVNDSVGNVNSTLVRFSVVIYGSLDVNISYPINNSNFSLNDVNFTINASVTCQGGTYARCGVVNALARYNVSSGSPDTAINTTFGATPFAYNHSNGKNLTGSFPVGLAGAPTSSSILFDPRDNSFWVSEYNNYFLFHFNSTGSNQSDSFSLASASGAFTFTYGITFDSTDNSFWIVEINDKFAYHLDSAGNNLTDGFSTAGVGAANPRGIAFDPRDNSFWLVDSSDNFVYHIDSTGNNLTDGFSTASSGIGNPYGITFDPTDSSFWIVDGDDAFVYCLDPAGNNLTDGFSTAGVGAANPRGIAFDPRDNSFWINEIEDDIVYHFSGKGNTQTSLKALKGGEILNVSWVLNITTPLMRTYAIDVFFNSSYGNANVKNNNTEDRLIVLRADEIPPSISITFPANNTNTTNTGLDVNYTVDSTAISCWYSNDSYTINTSLANCGTNITDVTWAEGKHNVTVWANDSIGNENSFSVYFTIDTTPPFFTNLANQTISNAQSLNYDINAQDDGAGLGSFAINWTTTFSIVASTGVLTNTSGLALGDYYINVSINDTLNNLNSSIIKVSVISADDNAPNVTSLTESPSDGVIYSPRAIYQFNATVLDISSISIVLLEFNGTNYSASSSITNVYNVTLLDLPAGAFNYRWFVNDTYGNTNSTETGSYTINQNTTSCDIYFNETSPKAYGNQFLVFTNCSSAFSMYKNGTVISNGSEHDLAAAAGYNFTVIRNDRGNYTNNADEASFTITKANLAGSLSSTKGWSYSYDNTETTISYSESNLGDADVVYKIFRDNDDKGSGETANLAAGNYNYKLNSTGGQNYSAIDSIDSQTLAISKATILGSLTSSNGWTINYAQGTTIGVSESNGGDADLVYSVYRNNVSVGAGAINLSAGTYYHRLNSTGGANYTANPSIDTKTLSVNQISSSVNLTLENKEANVSIIQGTSIDLNCSVLVGDSQATLSLYSNGDLVNQGTSPLGSTVSFSSKGIYNITCFYLQTTNFTQGSETWWLEVNDTTNPSIAITFPSNNTNTTNTGLDINYTASDNVAVGSCWYSNDSYSKNESLTNCGTNITDVTWAEGVHNIRVYVNDSSGNTNVSSIRFTVDTTQPAIAITFPSNNTNTSNTNLNVNYTVSDSVFVSSCWYSNDSYTKNESLANCGTNITGVTWIEGAHNIRVYVNDSVGNTNITSVRFTIDTTKPWISTTYPSNNTNTTNIGIDINYTVFDANWLGSCWYSNDSYTINTSLTNCGTNITDVTWTEGKHNVTIWVNDSVGNENSSSVYFMIDTTPPFFTNLVNKTIEEGSSLSYDINAQDNGVGLGSFAINWTNTFSIVASTGVLTNTSGLALGTYWINVSVNDSLGNINSSIIYVNVSEITDNDYPQFSEYGDNNGTQTEPGTAQLNVTVTSTNGAVTLTFGSTEYTASNSSGNSTRFNVTITNLNEGTYYYNWSSYGNGTLSRYNASHTMSYTVGAAPDLTNPRISIVFPSNNTNTSNTNLNVNYTASDAHLAYCWYSNDSYKKNTSLSNCANITGITWAEGKHNVTIWVNDTTGNENSSSIYFTIDTIKPAIAITFPSNNTNTTNAGLDVNYTVDSTAISCWYSNDSYTINTSLTNCGTNVTDVTWVEGVHNIRVYVNDSVGNINVSSIKFTIDTIKPNIEIIYPSNNTNTSNTNLNVNYTVSDSVFVSSCWYSNDSFSKNESLTNCGTNITDVTWTEGTHNVRVYVNDSSGNTNVSSIRFTVDATQPAIAITYPSNNTNTTNVGLDVNYTTSDTSLQNCWYSNDSYSANTSLTNCGTNITDVTWTEGTHNVRIYANDSAGNTNVTSIRFTIDTIKPAIAITFPSNNTNTSNTQLNINYTVSDSVFVSSCWYSNDSYTKNESLANCGTNITGVTWTEGAHNIRVYVNDSVGNTNVTSVRFTIDTTKPWISITSLSNNTNTSNTQLNINYSISDSNLAYCWYSNDSYKKNTSLSNCANITGITWVEGKHNITIWVNDSVGNENSSSIYFTIDTTKPWISIIFPANNTNTTNTGLNVNYTASDTNLAYCWYSNDSYSVNISLTDCANITTATWAEGAHNVRVYVNDSAGNENRSNVYFRIDTIPPYFTNLANQTIAEGSSLSYDINAQDAGVGLESFAINWTTTFSIVASTGVLTNTSGLALGIYRINITVNDTLGNKNFGTFYVNVTEITDNDYPQFSNFLSVPANASSYTQGQVYRFNATITANNGTVGLEFNGTNYTAANLSNSFSVAINDLGAGTYSYYWWAYGNGTLKNFNYTRTYYYTVNKSSNIVITKYLNRVSNNITIQYPQQVNATASSTQGTLKIYRNGADVTAENGLNVSLSAGYYEYKFNATGNSNYTDIESQLLYANITNATGLAYLYINGTRSNFSSENTATTRNIWLNATLASGAGNIELWVNGNLYNNGTSPQNNMTNLSAGFYNITSKYYGNENYSSDIEVFWVNATLNPPSLEILSPKNKTYFENTSLLLNYSASSTIGIDTVWYSLDSGANTTITSAVYFNTSTGSHSIYFYANSSNGVTTKNTTFFVNKTAFRIIYDEWKGSTKGNSTNFNQYSYDEIQNLSSIVLENTNFGKIMFKENINVTEDSDTSDNQVDLDENVNASSNRIELNSTALPNFNKSATLYLYNLGFTNPRILRNNATCSPPTCVEGPYSGGTFEFNVSSFAVYSAEETPVEAAPVTAPSGGGGAPDKGTMECVEDLDCEKDEVCVYFKCVKMFDIKIIDFKSPSRLGGFFEFTYFVKSMTGVGNDVQINFWIEKDGKRVTSGSDVIYLEKFEERTESTKIFLPTEMESGTHEFYVEIVYGDYSIRAHRTVEISIEEGVVNITPAETGKTRNYVLISAIVIFVLISLITLYLERRRILGLITREKTFIQKNKVPILKIILLVVFFFIAYYSGLFAWLIKLVLGIPQWFKKDILPNLLLLIMIILALASAIIVIIASNKKKQLSEPKGTVESKKISNVVSNIVEKTIGRIMPENGNAPANVQKYSKRELARKGKRIEERYRKKMISYLRKKKLHRK